MDEKPLTPGAQRARDEILEHLLQGREVVAIRAYMRASGKPLSEAKAVIDRLSQALETPALDAAEQRFLAAFRASLEHPERPPLETGMPKPLIRAPKKAPKKGIRPDARARRPSPRQRPRPASPAAKNRDLYAADGTPTGPPGVWPVVLHVLLAQLILSASFGLFSGVLGALGHLLSFWILAVVAMVMGVAIFMMFPVLLDRLLHRLGVRRWTRTPDLVFDFGLGLTLLVLGLFGAYTVERWLWYQRAEIIPLADAEQLSDKHAQGGREIYRIESLRVLPSPGATYSKQTTRNADRGGSYTDHWHVRLIATASPIETACLWLGWRSYTGRSGFDDPLAPWQAGDHYLIAADDRHYRRAVRLALNRNEAPGCTSIVNRIPPPSDVISDMERRLLLLLAVSAGLPWLLLLLITSYRLYRRRRLGKAYHG
ncbi:hypothetical protein [Thiorhodococcus minor]|uniref:Uncharacterized protein n=1 Tax=Thiorhodococcus minor TaxID=57489 RepID=A0A6M0K433_9GAMM|nr:hypothetical protein [Thiorhodococcus minor]NEV64011.1 hypothetical protein [Thiorhodococcus minor]